MKGAARWITAVAGLTLLSACAHALAPDHPQAGAAATPAAYGERSHAGMVDNTGKRVGTVTAWQGRAGLLLQVRVQGLPPGMHGLHLHAVGNCRDMAAFKASGGHVRHDGESHGFLHPAGPHVGDLPNLVVDRHGHAALDVFLADLTLAELRDADGTALVVHAARDDYQTPPIGGAGARIACAAFTAAR